MGDKYILVNGLPVEESDVLTWARWFEHHNSERVVAQDSLNGKHISTVFLGIDHNFTFKGDPILWETMIFGETGESDYQERYSSKQAAIDGHKRALWKVMSEGKCQTQE